jgi:uncharacterized flavoprotein (TIGR03862 family)
MAGRGGLNLTHSEPFDRFVTRYGEAALRLRPMLGAFSPRDLIAWAEGLGQQTFVGSSGRVFPEAMKASPLLRAWLKRLADQGVTIRTRMRWTGWDGDMLQFINETGASETIAASATLLALGGASWPKLGSDGSWVDILAARNIDVAPLKPANAGFEANWSAHFRDRFAGEPLKAIALRFDEHEARGEAIVTRYGLEGGAIYALSAQLRDAFARGVVTLHIDLRPTLTRDQVAAKLANAKRGDTLSSTLRKHLNLAPVAINFLRENGPLPTDADELARLIKAAPVTLTAARGIDRAISTAGGVSWGAVDENLQLRAIPHTYVAGEMLDWEAPTGGYLLQACFATAAWVARGILRG